MNTYQVSSRIMIMLFSAVLAFAGLIVNLYFLQIHDAPRIIATSQRAWNFYKFLPPTRGLILDRNQRPLALNQRMYTVAASKESINDITRSIVRVGQLLHLSTSEVHRHITALSKPEIQWRVIRKSVPESIKDTIESHQIPGIEFQSHAQRYYPEGSLAAHVIGFTGNENRGLAGLELTLNDLLEGTPQSILTDKDIHRRMIAEDDYTKKMTRGIDFVLTIDSYIQFIVERELKKVCETTLAKQANCVVLHPETGEILAMANYPSFDPNHYNEFSPEIRKNRLLTDIFEPGSVIKPFILSAALEQRAVTPQSVFYCEKGSYLFKGHEIRDDVHQFENLSVHDILVYSSNIGMVKIAQQLGHHPDDFRTQANILYNYLSRFGFKNVGEKTNPFLPGESGGMLRPPAKWKPASIGAIPFGQELSTNTLVLAAAYNVLANRGIYRPPKILLGKRLSNNLVRPIESEKPLQVLSNRVAEQVVQMMIDVTEDPEGTGRMVRIPGFHIAGKTGTAQKYDPSLGTYAKGKRVASFAGFFPAEKPQVVIVVVVDEPKKKKYGGEVAGPVFQSIAQELIAYWGLSPTDKTDPLFIAAMEQKKSEPDPQPDSMQQHQAFRISKHMPISPVPTWSVSKHVMPDLIGLPIREAYIRLTLNGLHAQFKGSGKVVQQPFPAGTVLNDKKSIGWVDCEPVLTDPDITEHAEWVVKR